MNRRVLLLCAALSSAAISVTASQAPPSLESAGKAGAVLPRLRSLLVSHRGELVLERYYGGARATQAANIKSASKVTNSKPSGRVRR